MSKVELGNGRVLVGGYLGYAEDVALEDAINHLNWYLQKETRWYVWQVSKGLPFSEGQRRVQELRETFEAQQSARLELAFLFGDKIVIKSILGR